MGYLRQVSSSNPLLRVLARSSDCLEAWAAGMDFAFALLPWQIIWNLQMLKAEKIGVGVAMSLGFL